MRDVTVRERLERIRDRHTSEVCQDPDCGEHQSYLDAVGALQALDNAERKNWAFVTIPDPQEAS